MWWVVENPNRTNSQKAAETTVTVNTVALDLPVPELVRDPLDVGTPDGFIICNTLIAPNRVARFRIPPSVDLPTDTEVTFTWRGWRDAAKTIPAPANTEFTATRRITAAETVSGMLFDVGPYDPVIRNVPLPPPATPDPAVDYFGYVEVQYTIPLGGHCRRTLPFIYLMLTSCIANQNLDGSHSIVRSTARERDCGERGYLSLQFFWVCNKRVAVYGCR